MAPVAGKQYAKLENKEDAVLVVDTGGTTFDVSLVVNNSISITQETWLGGRFTGDMLGIRGGRTKCWGRRRLYCVD